MLAITAASAVESGRGARAFAYAQGAAAIDPKNASAQFVLGRIGTVAASREEAGVTWPDVVARLRAALDKDAHEPLTGDDVRKARTALADDLLHLETDEGNKEARDVYKLALADVKDVPAAELAGMRYNYACALSRLKDLDEAFKMLGLVLEAGKTENLPGIEEIWRLKDDDLVPMRADDRWKALLEKYPAKDSGGGGSGGN
jgi:hypothetical protein